MIQASPPDTNHKTHRRAHRTHNAINSFLNKTSVSVWGLVAHPRA
jgi:hypothetical protein